MKHIPTIVKLYYLITLADGARNDKEIELGIKMIRYEKLDEQKFNESLVLLEQFNQEVIYNACIEELKKLNKDVQVHYLAWLGLIANSDGFMDKREWQLLYSLYHKELKIDLQNILKEQRDLANYINKPIKI